MTASRIKPEELERYKRRRRIATPLRMLGGLLLFSLPAGGPQRFYLEPVGIVFGILMLAQGILERWIQAPDTGGKKRDSASIAVAWIGYALTFIIAIADWFWIRPHFSLWSWSWFWVGAGLALVVAGQVLRFVAIRTLGAFFTATVRVHADHKVIQHGLYSLVRHPSYTGLLLLSLGYVTLFGSPFGYAAFLLFALPGMINRIQVEERALVRELGDEYKKYRRRVKRLIPYFY